MKNIKVLRIITRPNIGGPMFQIYALDVHLDKGIFQQVLFTGECNDDESDFLEYNSFANLRVVRSNYLNRKINLVKDICTLNEIRNMIKEYGPDIVHTHTSKAGVLGRLAAMTVRPRPKIVHTFHGTVFAGYFSRLMTLLIVNIERYLAQISDLLIAVGNQVREDLLARQIGCEKNLYTVSPGVNFPLFQSSKFESRKRLGLTEGVFYVAWVGRLVEIKEPERILEVARCLGIYDIDVRFCIAGDGPLREALEHKAKLENLPLDFLGWQHDVEPVLSASNMLLLTSANEGTPISLIQGQLAGLPVLSTDVGSVRDIVRDSVSGFVRDFNANTFAELIYKLRKDSTLCETLGEEGKRIAKSKFSPELLAARHAELYLKLME